MEKLREQYDRCDRSQGELDRHCPDQGRPERTTIRGRTRAIRARKETRMDTEETATIVRLVNRSSPAAGRQTTYETWPSSSATGFRLRPRPPHRHAHSERFCAAADSSRGRARPAPPAHRRSAPCRAIAARRSASSTPAVDAPTRNNRRARQETLARLALRDARGMQERPPHPPVSPAERLATYRVNALVRAQPGVRCVQHRRGTPRTSRPGPARRKRG